MTQTTLPKVDLATGVTGLDGAYLSELLLDKGHEVHGVNALRIYGECAEHRPPSRCLAIVVNTFLGEWPARFPQPRPVDITLIAAT